MAIETSEQARMDTLTLPGGGIPAWDHVLENLEVTEPPERALTLPGDDAGSEGEYQLVDSVGLACESSDVLR